MIKRVDKRLQAVQCLTGNKIKIIACITMLIDHFSKIFLEWCIASVQIRNALALPGHFSK